jgi:hypothetical protein
VSETGVVVILAYTTLASVVTAAAITVWKAAEAGESRRRAAEAEARAREAAEAAWGSASELLEMLRDVHDLESSFLVKSARVQPKKPTSRCLDEPVLLPFLRPEEPA